MFKLKCLLIALVIKPIGLCQSCFPKSKFRKNFIIGIDVSKDTLDFCMLERDSHRKLQQGLIANKEREIFTWMKNLDKENVVVVLEHTGYYGVLLSWLLEEQMFT